MDLLCIIQLQNLLDIIESCTDELHLSRYDTVLDASRLGPLGNATTSYGTMIHVYNKVAWVLGVPEWSIANIIDYRGLFLAFFWSS